MFILLRRIGKVTSKPFDFILAPIEEEIKKAASVWQPFLLQRKAGTWIAEKAQAICF